MLRQESSNLSRSRSELLSLSTRQPWWWGSSNKFATGLCNGFAMLWTQYHSFGFWLYAFAVYFWVLRCLGTPLSLLSRIRSSQISLEALQALGPALLSAFRVLLSCFGLAASKSLPRPLPIFSCLCLSVASPLVPACHQHCRLSVPRASSEVVFP